MFPNVSMTSQSFPLSCSRCCNKEWKGPVFATPLAKRHHAPSHSMGIHTIPILQLHTHSQGSSCEFSASLYPLEYTYV